MSIQNPVYLNTYCTLLKSGHTPLLAWLQLFLPCDPPSGLNNTIGRKFREFKDLNIKPLIYAEHVCNILYLY